jgi:large subunit ribosomal protein L22
MGKQAKGSALAPNEAMARAAMLKVSPQKLNLVANQIAGMKVSEAIVQLTFSQKRIAKDVKKVLQSAIANAENNYGLDVDSLIVSEASVGKAMVLKRFHPRGRGKGSRIFKPFSKLRIVVREQVEGRA